MSKHLKQKKQNMKICPYCESELSDTAKKCKYCGEWVVTMENPFRKGDKKNQFSESNNLKNKNISETHPQILDSSKTTDIEEDNIKNKGFETHVFDDDNDDDFNDELENNTEEDNDIDEEDNDIDEEDNDIDEEDNDIDEEDKGIGNNKENETNKQKHLTRQPIVAAFSLIFTIIFVICFYNSNDDGKKVSNNNEATKIISTDNSFNNKNNNKTNNQSDKQNKKIDITVNKADKKEEEKNEIKKEEGNVESNEIVYLPTNDITNKENNNTAKKSSKPSCGKWPGTVYRSEDGMCACPGDPVHKSSWNESTRSCSKSNSNNNTQEQQQNNNYVDCNDSAVMLACSLGGDACPTKCYNYINSSTKNEIQQELSNSLNQINECNDSAVMLACSLGADSCPRACRN